VLKLAGNWYLSIIGSSVTAQALGGIVGVIVWINVVARFAFYTASWTATVPAIEQARLRTADGPAEPAPPAPVPEGAVDGPRGDGARAGGPSPAGLALGLLGGGALAGAVASRVVSRAVRGRTGRRTTRAAVREPSDGGAAGS